MPRYTCLAGTLLTAAEQQRRGTENAKRAGHASASSGWECARPLWVLPAGYHMALQQGWGGVGWGGYMWGWGACCSVLGMASEDGEKRRRGEVDEGVGVTSLVTGAPQAASEPLPMATAHC